MDADALSPVAQDYLKVIWSAVEWGDAPITTTGSVSSRTRPPHIDAYQWIKSRA